MVKIYSTAKVNGMSLEPEITEIMATSRDYNELLDVYIGWRNATGPLIKKLYPEFIDILNIGLHPPLSNKSPGAKEAGKNDTGGLWRSGYDMEDRDFQTMMKAVWDQVLPLYEVLSQLAYFFIFQGNPLLHKVQACRPLSRGRREQ